MKVLEPRILKEIERRMDDIVELAERAIRETKVYGRRCSNNHWTTEEKCPECKEKTQPILQRAQLSNLLNLANATDSVKALELFVYYQMGRKEGKGWRYPEDQERPFGYWVINDFSKLAQWAEEIAPSQRKEVHFWLIRLYVGCLNRWFVALGAESTGEGEGG